MASTVGCFAGFCHHHLMTISVHMHAYCYPLFESGMKTGLWPTVLCRKDRALLCKQKEQQWNTKVIGALLARYVYGESIIDVL